MASLIEAYDWSKTSLGKIESWSSSMRTSLSMMLKSRFPMLIFWGPDLITFYNDAFRPSLGNDGKHPGSLGQRGEESWAESWPVISPMIQAIMAGGDAVWFEDQKLPIYREGKMDFAYWTYSFSAISNGEGIIEGLLVTCAETTKAVSNLQKLQESKDELAFAIEATELGTWDLNPITNKFTANARLKQWFGLQSNEELSLSMATKVIDEPDRKRVLAAISRALDPASDGVYEIEYTIVHPSNFQKRIVRAKGKAWFGDDKKACRFNGTLQDITAQKLTEQKQQELNDRIATAHLQASKKIEDSEAKLRLIIEQAPVAIGLFSGKGENIIEFANERMMNIWGKKSDVIGKKLLDGIPELKGQPFDAILNEIYETKKPFEGIGMPAQLILNGKLDTYYFDFTYQPIINKEGQVTGILDIALDVTQQVKAKKALEESELFSRSVIDHSPIAKIVFIGPEMILNTVNRSMMELLQKDESIIGKTYYEVFPELRKTHLPKTMLHVFKTGETFSQPEERIALIKNGKLQTGYYSYIYKALKNTEGNIYGIIVTATDITEQVLARQKVEDAENRLTSAIELAELSTWSVDIQTMKSTYSPRLQEWLGVKEGILSESQTRIIEKDHERVMKAVMEAISPGGSGRFDEVYTIVNSKTGQQRIIHAHGRLTYDDTGKPVQLAGVAQDVTLQKELQLTLENEVEKRTEQLAAINSELMRSNQELSQYAYVASHDLQEPLRKIQVFSDRLREQHELSASSRKYAEKINSAAERMRLLIKDLLEFSRLLKQQDSEKKPVNLNMLVQEIRNDFELIINEKDAVIQIDTLPTIEAVALQMNQLFYNLIGNALKFSKTDVAPIIEIFSEAIPQDSILNYVKNPLDKEYYKISIKDNGIGFNMDYTEHIFEVFRRLHSKDEYPGSGIGLSLCRNIVINHNGYIYAESEVGKGSVFTVILPR